MTSLFLKLQNFLSRQGASSGNKAFLEDKFQIKIKDFKIYSLALTHRSHSSVTDNERLELLGDAVLDLVVADYIFHKFPNMDEGVITKLKSKFISRDNLIKISHRDNLIEGLDLSKQKDLRMDLIIGNVLEAIFGAMYIDQGFSVTRKRAIAMFERTCDINQLLNDIHDPKSQLLEWAQKHRKEIRFEIDAQGRDLFESCLFIDGSCVAKGTGKSKKKSEKDAARNAISALKIVEED